MTPGDPFWLQKRSQIHVGETRNPKNAQKKSFSDHAISCTFFKAPKILNNPPKEAQGKPEDSTFCPRTETFRKVNLPKRRKVKQLVQKTSKTPWARRINIIIITIATYLPFLLLYYYYFLGVNPLLLILLFITIITTYLPF